MKRHTEELKEMIGEWLRRDPGRGNLKVLSESLRVSPKTLNNWKRKRPKKTGRPRHTESQRKEALWAVARELRAQGYAGEKVIEFALPHVPLRLIREYVSALKMRRRIRLEFKKRRARRTIRIKAKGVIIAQDGAHLGRDGINPVDAQVLKDQASLKIIETTVGPPSEEHVLKNLRALEAGGRLPLVWSTDNGSAYCTSSVEEFLHSRKIIHLRNLPRTPQHNASVERAVRELKEVSALGCGVYVNVEFATRAILKAAKCLNERRFRPSIGGRSSAVDEKMPAGYNLVNRDEFYAECNRAMCEARKEPMKRRRQRLEERNAIYATLEKYELIEITVGGK